MFDRAETSGTYISQQSRKYLLNLAATFLNLNMNNTFGKKREQFTVRKCFHDLLLFQVLKQLFASLNCATLIAYFAIEFLCFCT